MKIVIDIPEGLFEAYKGRPPRLGDEGMDMIAQAIANGTPVSKGQGRLIDADELKTAFPCGEFVRTECVRATIDHAPTIIEADKEEEK